MSSDTESLSLKLKEAGGVIQTMLSKASSILPGSSEILEFIKLLANDVEKLGLELKIAVESTSGVKGLFGARKKSVRLLSEKLSRLEGNMLEAQAKIYGYCLDYLAGLDESLKSVERDFTLIREETAKRGMNWSVLVEFESRLGALKSELLKLLDYLGRLKNSNVFNIIELSTVTDNIIGWRSSLEEFKRSLDELERRIAFRNLVYVKVMDVQGGVDARKAEFFKTIGLDFQAFLDRLASRIIVEDTEQLFLEEALQLLDSISECFRNLGEIVFLLQDAGIPLNIVLEQPDVKNSLTLFKIILEKFRVGFREYVEQESLFVDKLRLICLEVHTAVKSILSYLDRLGDVYRDFRNRILGVISSWLLNFKEKGGWDGVRRLLITLENFLLNHYPAITECIRNRLRGVNSNTIRGAALFQNCIPGEYAREQFIYDTILPLILEGEGVNVLMNVLRAYGERGWVKRAEVKNISSEYIEDYIKNNSSIRLVRVDGYEILFSPEILVKKIKNVSKESLYNYFNKYLSDNELCRRISEEVFKHFQQVA